MPREFHANEDCPDPVRGTLTLSGLPTVTNMFCPGHDLEKRWTLEELRNLLMEFHPEENYGRVKGFLDWLGEQ